MTLRLIPSVYQMLFNQRYARKQVSKLFEEKKESLRSSAIKIEKGFKEASVNIYKGGYKVGKEDARIDNIFGIKRSLIMVIEFKNTGKGENDNNIYIYNFDNFISLFRFMKAGNYIKTKHSELIRQSSYEQMIPMGLIDKDLYEYISEDVNTSDIKNKFILEELVSKKAEEVTHPFIANETCKKTRIYKYVGGNFLADYIDIIVSENNAYIPEPFMPLKNISSDFSMTKEVYEGIKKKYASKYEKKMEKMTGDVYSEFAKEIGGVLKILDYDLDKLGNPYSERKIPQESKVKIQKKQTEVAIKKEIRKREAKAKLLDRTRLFIYRNAILKKTKRTLPEFAKNMQNRLNKYKSLFSNKNTEFKDVFDEIIFELEQGATYEADTNGWKINVIHLKKEKEKDISYLVNEKEEIEFDILNQGKKTRMQQFKELNKKAIEKENKNIYIMAVGLKINKEGIYAMYDEVQTELEYQILYEMKQNNVPDDEKSKGEFVVMFIIRKVGGLATNALPEEQTIGFKRILIDIANKYGVYKNRLEQYLGDAELKIEPNINPFSPN